MKCPGCGHLEDRVIDSRATKAETAIRRRRECLACGQRFTTYEEIEAAVLYVIKRDGRREPFDRAKLWGGIRRATEKRPIPAAVLESAVDQVEAEIRALGVSEVSSARVGERVMAALRDIDAVAYVRFASVYRQFRDVSQFMDEVKSLTGEAAPGGVTPAVGTGPGAVATPAVADSPEPLAPDTAAGPHEDAV
jgi:transcriptional repressor NrdR